MTRNVQKISQTNPDQDIKVQDLEDQDRDNATGAGTISGHSKAVGKPQYQPISY